MSDSQPKIVITGLGVISPLGNTLDEFRASLEQTRSGITELGTPFEHLPTSVAGRASGFTGDIEQFGEMEKTLKRSIKKGLKLMCREIQMGVAAAQLATNDAGLLPEGEAASAVNRERIGVLFGCDYILSIPEEFTSGVRSCLNEEGNFQFDRWAEQGLPKVDPLWLLKSLPNMPACHFAIYHDLRGPNNSLTVREASSNLAITEALNTLQRGSADAIVVGGTGCRIHTSRSVHISLQEQISAGQGPAAEACRPFDAHRDGMVLGEGAGALIMETESNAAARGAKPLATVLAGASSTVADTRGVANYRQAFENVIRRVLDESGMQASDIGHVNAHGLATGTCDQQEAEAIQAVLSDQIPVFAPKSYMGNLGAGSGMVESIASILCLQQGQLYPTLNCVNKDAACPINVITGTGTSAGDNFINLNVTPQGQASAVLIAKA